MLRNFILLISVLVVGLLSACSGEQQLDSDETFGSGSLEDGTGYVLLSSLEDTELDTQKYHGSDGLDFEAVTKNVVIEVNEFPIEPEQLAEVLDLVVAPVDQTNYDTISVAVKYHRGEKQPAFGIWHKGKSLGSFEGNSSGELFDWRVPLRTKLDDSSKCVAPPKRSFEIMQVYWHKSDNIQKGESAFEQTMQQFDITREEYDAVRAEVDRWISC